MKSRAHADSSSMKSKVNPRLLIVLGVVLVLLVGFGAVRVLGGGDDATPEESAVADDAAAAPEAPPESSEGAPAGPDEPPVDGTPVVDGEGAGESDWASQANVICERAVTDLAGQPTPQSEEEAAALLAEARALVDELGALPPPAGAEAEAAEFVSLLNGAMDAADQLVTAGANNDLQQLTTIVQEQSIAQARLLELATVLGVEACVGSASVGGGSDALAGVEGSAGVAGLLELQEALQKNDPVVLVVYSPKAELDTRVVREARAGANGSGAGFVAVNGTREGQIKVLAETFNLRETPATLVVNRGLIVTGRFSGFADRETVAQAVKDSLGAS